MGIIARAAIENFLTRRLRDSARAKLFTSRALTRKIEHLDPPPDFHTPLRKHQKVSFLLGVRRRSYCFFLDMGTGKSLVSICLFRYAKKLELGNTRKRPRAVVLAPYGSNLGQWALQVREHAPMLRCVIVDGAGTENRWAQVESDKTDVVVMTYAGFLSLVCSGKPVTNKKTGKPKLDKKGNPVVKGWKIDDKKLRRFIRRFTFFIGDESTAFANCNSLTHRAVRKLAWACPWRYAMSGKPYGKNPEALWGQFYAIDKGETLGETLGLLRAAMFTESRHPYTGFPVHTFDQSKKRVLNRMLRHNSVRYRIEECADLPPRTDVIVPVIFDPETWQYYDRLVQQIKDSRGALDVVDSAFIRMRQLTAGYLKLTDAEGGTQVIRFQQKPKIEALLDLIEQFPDGEKVVIFHEYKLTGEVISEALKSKRIKHVRLFSGTRDKSGTVEQFLTDPKVRVIVSSSAGSMGGNWQVARRFIWAECPCDPKILEQEERRGYRMGQTRKVFLYQLVVKGSIDERILHSTRSGESLYRAIVEGEERDLDRR